MKGTCRNDMYWKQIMVCGAWCSEIVEDYGWTDEFISGGKIRTFIEGGPKK